MAAAEYYNVSAAQATPHQSPYQQSPYQQPHELHGSPVPQYSLPPQQQLQSQQTPPPPYYPTQQDSKPSVHFAQTSVPPKQNRPSSARPSFSSQTPSNHGQHIQPPPHHSPYAQHASPSLTPQAAMQPPHMRPYMNANQSEYSLAGGYSSDPEQRRRRRHKRHEHKDEEHSSRDTSSRDERPRKNRSRSTNTDGLLGAAGGSLIGDLIFPGLGTVGGAVAGWIGGKDYGKRRHGREEKLQREQKEWEHRFRDRSNSDERKHGHRDHKQNPRRNSEY